MIKLDQTKYVELSLMDVTFTWNSTSFDSGIGTQKDKSIFIINHHLGHPLIQLSQLFAPSLPPSLLLF